MKKSKGRSIVRGSPELQSGNNVYVHLIHSYFLTCRLFNDAINLLNLTGYVMHHQFNIQYLCTLPTLY
jgi:hypothetical protein